MFCWSQMAKVVAEYGGGYDGEDQAGHCHDIWLDILFLCFFFFASVFVYFDPKIRSKAFKKE